MSGKDTNIIDADEFFLSQIKGESSVEDKSQPVGIEEMFKADISNQPDEEVILDKDSEGDEPNLEETNVEEKFDSILTSKNNPLKDSVNILLQNEAWSDSPIKYGDEEYDSISELLEKVEIDEEMFESLKELQNKIKEDELKSKYIPVEGTDSHKVKLAKAILEGVEYEDLLEHERDVINPINNLDMNDTLEVKKFVITCLKSLENIPDKWLMAELEDLERNGMLIEKAEEFQSILNAKYEREIEERTARVIQERTEKINRTKESIKNFRKSLKEENYSNTFIDKAVQLRYNVDSETGMEHYVHLIKDKMQDPSFEKKLIHFLLDENDFLSKVKSPVKSQTQRKMLELTKGSKNKEGRSIVSGGTSVNLQEADANFLALLDTK